MKKIDFRQELPLGITHKVKKYETLQLRIAIVRKKHLKSGAKSASRECKDSLGCKFDSRF